MRIGIIGAGAIGQTVGRLLAGNGHDVLVFLSGDDGDAKATAAPLVRDAGFDPVDLGTSAGSACQEPGGKYYGEEFHLTDVPALPLLTPGACARDCPTPTARRKEA